MLIRRFVKGFLEALGGLWIATQIGVFFFPEIFSSLQTFFLQYLILGVVFGLLRMWPRLKVHSEISDTDVSIVIRVGDLFNQNGSVIIAAPTSFDTAMDDGTIDEGSVQGQFTRRFCDSSEKLKQQIVEALDGVAYIEELSACDKPYGNRKKYPVGTVAPVKCGGKKAYFVALATLNKHRNASLDSNELLDALTNLWENIRNRGGMEPINMPILGSGFSRLNLTREVLVREIVKSFVVATRAGKFCEQITIVIRPRDFLERRIDLESIGSFLKQECQYGNTVRPKNPKTSGTAV